VTGRDIDGTDPPTVEPGRYQVQIGSMTANPLGERLTEEIEEARGTEAFSRP
jgi:hypothetical protein